MARPLTLSLIPLALLLPVFATQCAEVTGKPPVVGEGGMGGLGGSSSGTGGTTGSGGTVSGTGGDAPVVCENGEVLCAGSCILPNTNSNCGACYHSCVGGQECADSGDGTFACACPEGQLVCSNICANPLTSENFCGASGSCTGDEAGEACGEFSVCDNGECVCDDTHTRCDGACVDTLTDEAHCSPTVGSCGVACDTNEVCKGGSCSCPFSTCGGNCIDTNNDPNNCGGCAGSGGVVCNGATPLCGGGVCVSGPCDSDLVSGCSSVTTYVPFSGTTPTGCTNGISEDSAGAKCEGSMTANRCFEVMKPYTKINTWWSGGTSFQVGKNGSTQTYGVNVRGSALPAPVAGGHCVKFLAGDGNDGFSLGTW